jgi:hypothetical protein
MSEKQEPYIPYGHTKTCLAQQAAMEMAIKLDDNTRKRQAILIRALMYLVGIQTVGIFLLAMFT